MSIKRRSVSLPVLVPGYNMASSTPTTRAGQVPIPTGAPNASPLGSLIMTPTGASESGCGATLPNPASTTRVAVPPQQPFSSLPASASAHAPPTLTTTAAPLAGRPPLKPTAYDTRDILLELQLRGRLLVRERKGGRGGCLVCGSRGRGVFFGHSPVDS